jgi:hypothetical protein
MDAHGCKKVVEVFLSSPLLHCMLFTNYVHLQTLVGRNNPKPFFAFVLFLNHFGLPAVQVKSDEHKHICHSFCNFWQWKCV